jgi:hypothetical protein
VLKVARDVDATPYDVPGVEMGHVGEMCSFDAFLAKYRLDDPALRKLAAIVRGADTGRLELTPQSAGLHAISLGLSINFADDHEMLRHGLVMYDALYACGRLTSRIGPTRGSFSGAEPRMRFFEGRHRRLPLQENCRTNRRSIRSFQRQTQPPPKLHPPQAASAWRPPVLTR